MTSLRSGATRTFVSLKVRNYRLYFVGQFVSMTGTWMQSIAMGWLVITTLHRKGGALGIVVALQFLPVLLAGAWGGVIADRFDKRRTLMITQTAMAIFAGGLAVVTIAGIVTYWMVCLSALLLGCANAIDNPTRQAFVSEMAGADTLANAVALNSAMFNAARIIGPAVGGLIITLVGVGPCFAYNAVSFIGMIVALSMMRPDELFRGEPIPRKKGQIREGLSYAWHDATLRSTLILVGVVGTLALNFTVTMPLLAKDTFNGNGGTLGWMTACMGVGSMVGALWTASRIGPTARLLAMSCLAFGVLMTAVALAPTLAIGLPLLTVMGMCSITFMATANSTLQLTSTPAMRGRVMALYALLFLGSTPIGAPLVGWICQRFGTRYGFGLGGIATLAAGLYASSTLLRARTLRRRQAPTVPAPEAEPAVV
jgi:MFS family permease